MSEYIALTWRPGAPTSQAAHLQASLVEEGGWRPGFASPGLWVGVRGVWALGVRALPSGQGALIGDIYDRRATDAGRFAPFDISSLRGLTPLQSAQRLSEAGWGRYVALLVDGGDTSVFRDPSGALDCASWRCGDVTVASNSPPFGPARPSGLSIDWGAVATILHTAAQAAILSGLTGISSVQPGVLVRQSKMATRDVIWTPAQIARHPRPHTPADLASRLDAVMEALVHGRKTVVAEVSGGLDSSIVATTLARHAAPMVTCINQASDWAESNEKTYARAVAAMVGAPLLEIERPIFRFEIADLTRCAEGLRPAFNAQDPPYDLAMARLLKPANADVVFTGQGGDVVFFQMLAPSVSADLVLTLDSLEHPLRALITWAQRSRLSVWQTLFQGMTEGRRPEATAPPPFLGSTVRPPAAHPWLADTKGLPPGKRHQLFTLTNTQALAGDSLRGRAVEHIHPLLTQPVLELCLQTPVTTLAVGARDRPFARTAFADRLPEAVLRRRGKGDTASFYAQSVAASLDVLKPYLLEGRLAAEGLVDAQRLEALLDPQVMVWRSVAGPILRAAHVEAWVRSWEARL